MATRNMARKATSPKALEDFRDIRDFDPDLVQEYCYEFIGDMPDPQAKDEDVSELDWTLRSEIKEFIAQFTAYPDPFPIYRIVTVDNPDAYIKALRQGDPGQWEDFADHLKPIKGLGIYWTWDKDVAQDYNEPSKEADILFTAMVAKSSVDWEQTILKNASSLGDEEREITLFRGVPVHLVWVENKNTGKKYKADIELTASLQQGDTLENKKAQIAEADFRKAQIIDERPYHSDLVETYNEGTGGSVHDIRRDIVSDDPFGIFNPTNKGVQPPMDGETDWVKDKGLSEGDFVQVGQTVSRSDAGSRDGEGQIAEVLGNGKVLVYFPQAAVKLQVVNAKLLRPVFNSKSVPMDQTKNPEDALTEAPDDYTPEVAKPLSPARDSVGDNSQEKILQESDW